MQLQEAVERHQQMLWEAVENAEYPSTAMLDRLEKSLRTREDAEAFLELLFEKVQHQYPSVVIMARIQRVVNALATLERLQEQAQQPA